MDLVGRVREREELRRLADQAQAGRGSLVLIRGEAGVGKTALVTWVVEQTAANAASHAAANAASHAAANGASHAASHAPANGAVAVAIARCAGPDETPLYGPWRDLAAQVDRLSWPVPLLPRPESPSPSPVYGYDLAAMLAQSIQTAGQPLVMAIEDIQWADAPSLELLTHLARHVARLPLLLLATYRSADAEPLRAAIADLQRAGAVRLPLERFTPDEVTELTAAALPERSGAGLIAHYLHQRTGGHPLFLCELLAVARTGRSLDGPLPDTVQQAIDQQLGQLPPSAVTVLQAAAVIGERFGYDLLLQVTGEPEDEVVSALEAALAVRLLRHEGMSGEQFVFDHALVREVLLGQLIGARRRRWHLRIAGALIAGTAPTLITTPEPETVALHLERAGDPRAVSYLLLAADRALRVGARSQAVARYEQALALLAAPGSQRTAETGAGSQRSADTGAGAQRAEALLKLAYVAEGAPARAHCAEALQAATATGDAAVAVWARHQLASWHAADGHPGALSELQAVRAAQEALLADDRYQRLERALYGEALAYPRISGALARALTKAGRRIEAEALVGEMQARTRPGEPRTPILSVQWWMAGLLGRWEEALMLGQRLSEAHQAEGDERAAFSVASNRLYHVLLCKADEPARVDEVAADLLRLAERLAAVSGYDPLAAGHPPLGWYSYLRGDWEAARRHLLGYIQRHPSDADPGVRGFAALLQLAQGDTAGARATLLAVPPLHPDEEPRLHMVQLSAYTMRAELCLTIGDVGGAKAWLDAAARYQQQRGGTAFQAFARLAWARFYLAAGDLPAADAEVGQALTRAESPREFRALIAACRLAGEVAARQGRLAEAAAHLQRARELAARCSFPYEVAMADLVQAETLRGTSTDLTEARATFARLGAAPALARAEALLAGAGALPGASERPGERPGERAGERPGERSGESPADHPAPELSARELQIVRLVAAGLTDKEIAGRLFISPRTVDGHLRRIFAKLAVPSRAALAAHAVRQGWL